MRIFKITAALLICLMLIASGNLQPAVIIIPDSLSEQLKAYKKKNDLTNWIYSQLDWVGQSPVERTALLNKMRVNAWRMPSGTEEAQAWLILLMNEGHSMLLTGNIVASTDAYRTALKWIKEHGNITSDDQILEYILKPLGNNYTRLGDYEQALYIQKKAVEIATALNNKAAVAGTYSNLATTSASMGSFEQSLLYCNMGLKAAQENTAVKGLLLSERSEAYIKLNKVDSARISIRQGLQLLEKEALKDAGNMYWLFMAYQQAGDIYLNEPPAAETYYKKALTLQTQLLNKGGAVHQRESAKLFYRLGFLCKGQHRYNEAISWFEKCAGQLIPGKTFSTIRAEDLYGENTLVDVLSARAELLADDQRPDESLQLYQLCFIAEKKLRTEYITGASKERSVADSRSRYEAAIQAAYKAWHQTKKTIYAEQALGFIESGKAQLLLEELMQQQQYPSGNLQNDSITNRIRLLEKALVFHQKNLTEGKLSNHKNEEDEIQQKQIEWELADLHKKGKAVAGSDSRTNTILNAPFNYRDITGLLKPGQLIRSFFTGTRAIYTVETGRQGIHFIDRQPISPSYTDTIGLFIQRYFQNGPEAMQNNPRRYYREAYSIYQTIFGKHPLNSAGQYILLPDGVLNALPVDALVSKPDYTPSPEQWPFIIKETNISYAYSLQTLKEQLFTVTVTGIKGFTGLFIAENAMQDPQLQSVLKEKDGIAQSVKAGNWLLNQQATAAAFYKALEESSVLHISSHASAGKEIPVAPHIQLYDAPFYLFELKGLRQHPALAVLSACRTGDGRQISGEGIQSLARAFIANGTNAVIAGWWNVNDEATASLMSRFYASLADKTSTAGALREAKINWLNDSKTPWLQKLPYYWASLNYQGAPDALADNNWMNSKPAHGLGFYLKLFLIASLLLLCTLLFWRQRRRSFSR